MGSTTTWNRVESLPRSGELVDGLRAELADPLWLLARQRQFGELRGEDAGSPIEAKFRASSARLSRYHPGAPAAGAEQRSRDHRDDAFPLETLVEREAVWGQLGDARLAVEAGLQFVRFLKKHRAANRRAAYVAAYGVRAADIGGDDPAAIALARASVGRVPHGRRLHDDLRRARGTRNELTALPSEPDVGSDATKVLAAANDFLRWWDAFISEPAAGDDAWHAERLEHRFAVQAQLPDGRVTLVADEYHGGRLDWYHFRAESRTDLGSSRRRADATDTVRTVIPTPVTYGGMPADRLWEIEDSTVRFGGLSTGRTDLARLLLGEFALTYSNDWFVIPIDLPVGSLCRVERLSVTDTFGVSTTVQPVTDTGRWSMFDLAAPGAPQRVQQLMFLPPTLLETHESEPVESVAFVRDEMANVVWGIERAVPSAAGGSVDRYEEYQRRLAAGEYQQVDIDVGDAELLYRLQSFVPDHWHPFVPVVDPRLQLERRPVQRVDADGTTRIVEPLGRVLTSADPLRVEEEEVPRAGVVVSRRFQLTRWTDGRTIVWSGRRKRSGRGEASSGLEYDAARRVGRPSD